MTVFLNKMSQSWNQEGLISFKVTVTSKLEDNKRCNMAVPYQPQENTSKLDDVGVCHTVEPPHPGVEHGDQGRAYHSRVQVHL